MSDGYPPINKRCDTEGCYRETKFVYRTDFTPTGEFEKYSRSFCEPCKNVVQWSHQIPPNAILFMEVNE